MVAADSMVGASQRRAPAPVDLGVGLQEGKGAQEQAPKARLRSDKFASLLL